MIDWVVVVWCLASAATFVIAAIGVRDAIHDLRAIRGEPNGTRTVAWMHFRNQLGRVVIGIAWTAVGIPTLLDERVTPLSVGVVVLVGGNVILAGNAALDLRSRRKLLVPGALTGALVTIDEQSTILYANDVAHEMFGYERGELVGTSLLTLQPEKYRPAHLAAFARFRETGQRTLDWDALRLEGLRKDGSVFPISIALFEGQLDGHRVVTGIINEREG